MVGNSGAGPPDGGDYVVTRADSAQGPWAPISPKGLTATAFEDTAAPAQPLAYYLVATRVTDDCWSVDPYRP